MLTNRLAKRARIVGKLSINTILIGKLIFNSGLSLVNKVERSGDPVLLLGFWFSIAQNLQKYSHSNQTF